jgi:transketolase
LYQNNGPQEGFVDGIGEDLFFLSNGHISLYFTAFWIFFPVAELATFRLINTRLGHPTTHDHLGVRIASGSLGQGLSVGIGAAQAKKLNNDNHLVYTSW